MKNFDEYLYGKKLYGDDFTLGQLKEWYDDEKEGFANLVTSELKIEEIQYFCSDWVHVWQYIKEKRFRSVLGIGSASGYEFKGYQGKIDNLTIIEPSDIFVSNSILGIPCRYVKPDISGKIPFEENSFDLITCLGVLHHIANVSFVIKEMFRCTSPRGIVIIRDPIVSMGDWRKKRPGLTKRERGIPLQLFREFIKDAGFEIIKESLFSFSILRRIYHWFNFQPFYRNKYLTIFDKLICRFFSFKTPYHAKSFIDKFRPTGVYFILRKKAC